MSWFDFISLKLTFMVLLFCSLVHAASLYSSLMIFHCDYILTVSLPSLFHFCPVFSRLSSSSRVFFYLPCTTVLLPLYLSLLSWFTQLSHTQKTPQHCLMRRHPHLARNLQIQQVLQPVDPQVIPGLVRKHLDSETEKDGHPASASQLSHPSELTQPSSTGNPP